MNSGDKSDKSGINWDLAADVVVAGYGGAGAAAAITAHDRGAEVLVLESMPRGGGNTAVSMGGFLCPNDYDQAVEYIDSLYDLSRSDRDPELVRVFAEESIRNADWIRGLREGVNVQVYGHAGYPQLPGAGSMDKYLVSGKGQGLTVFAQNLWELLSDAVENQRGIRVMTETPAKRLVTNGNGAVIGVMAESGGKEIAVQARRAVILTTGGYEFDVKTLQNSVKGFPVYSIGSPGNRGDGVRLAQAVGAGLWHMNGVSCALGLKVPEFESAFMMMIGAPGHILIDRRGRRFVNERAIETHAGLLAVDYYDTHALEYPRIPCFAVFDETARLAGPISRTAGLGAAGQAYEWSRDNSKEVEQGWILKADTLPELAGKLAMDPDALAGTIEKWNQDVQNGQDTLFGRPVSAAPESRPAYQGAAAPVLSAPIVSPPFYALTLHPCLLNTQGGPRRDVKARVLDAFGTPIPRLYSAGELGSMWGLIYQGAGNIAECLVFGRIAGTNAAAETPWIHA